MSIYTEVAEKIADPYFTLVAELSEVWGGRALNADDFDAIVSMIVAKVEAGELPISYSERPKRKQ